MADPLPTGTIADTVEALPQLGPVRPTGQSLKPVELGEVFAAANEIQLGENLGGPAKIQRDGWQKIVAALDLPDHQNPELNWGADDSGLEFYSSLAGKRLSKRAQQQLIVDRMNAVRMNNPQAFLGLPDTVEGLQRYWNDEALKSRRAAQDVVSRSEGLSGALASLGGGVWGGLQSPEAPLQLAIGGFGGGTLRQIFVREFFTNALVEAVVQPGLAQTREFYGEELTVSEAIGNVVVSGLAGGTLEAGATGIGRLGGRLYDDALPKLFELMPERVQRKWADKMSVGDVKLIDVLGDVDNRELAGMVRRVIGEDNLTPDQTAAIATIERDQDIGATSPFMPGAAGNAAHEGKLAQAISDLLEGQRVREAAERPLAPRPVTQDTGGDVGRPPAAPSTAAERPRTSIVSGEAAIAGFKRKTRGVESGGNDAADNPLSSADGRYQITDGTFRSYYKRLYGRDPGAQPSKAVKNDPATQEAIMDALTRDNAAGLQAIGETVNEGNLYLMHFLGAGDGPKLFRAEPDAPIERVLPPAVLEANPFLKGKSASQVIQWAHKKMGGDTSAVAARGPAGTLVSGEADPRIAQLRDEALQLDNEILQLTTRLADGAAVNLYTRQVPASAIGVDAKRFQFKEGGDEFGVTERLKGIKEYDHGQAGRITLWEDEAGKLWVADGHQRHGLARRISAETGVDIALDVMILRERDGVSAIDARVWAALKNIAEDSGSLVDAAKVLRDAGAGALDRVPPKSPLVRDGRALSRLSDDAFGAVVNERLPADQAAAIGHLLPDSPELHGAIIDLLIKTAPANRAQAHSIVRQAIAAGFHEGEQIDLFGSGSSIATLFAEKAKILERGLARLKRARLVHKTAAKEADTLEAAGSKIAVAQSEKEAQANAEAVALIDRLAYRAGPVADALDAAARQLAAGGRLSDAADGFVDRIRELDLRALDDGNAGDRVAADGTGLEGDAGETGPSLFEEPSDPPKPSLAELEAATERFSDPDGPAAKQQAESLVHDLRAVEDARANLALERDSATFVGLHAILTGKPEGELNGWRWKYQYDPEGDWISITKDGEAGDLGDTVDFLLARRADQAFNQPVFDELAAEAPRIQQEIADIWSKHRDDSAAEFERRMAEIEAKAVQAGVEGSDVVSFSLGYRAGADGRRFDYPGNADNPQRLLFLKGYEQGKIDRAYGNAPIDRPIFRLPGNPADRRERIRAATAALEGVKPGELRAIEVFPDEEPGYHRFRYVAQDGTAVGGNYTIDGGPPPFLEGFNVGDTNNPVKLGAAEVRKLFAEIRRQHPEIERIHAFRMTGARAEATEMWIDLAGKGQGTKPEDVEIHAGDAPEEGVAAAPPARSAKADLLGGTAAPAIDPARAARQRQLAELGAAAPLRPAGDVETKGDIGLALFDAANQGTFRLGEDGDEISAADLLAELDDDDKAIAALRGCL